LYFSRTRASCGALFFTAACTSRARYARRSVSGKSRTRMTRETTAMARPMLPPSAVDTQTSVA
jgi:hypothetical protein